MIFEKIREKLDEECWLTTNDDGETNNLSEKVVSLKAAIDIINQVEAEYNNGWISVENELPEKFDSVLVSCEGSVVGGTHEGEKCEFVATGYMFSKDHWQIQGHNDVKYIKVIAWQTLPECYTPKGE